MRFSSCRTITTIVATLGLAALPVIGQDPDRKRLEEAAVRLEETLKSAPGNGEAASRLVAVLRELAAAAINSDPERALAHLVRAKELEPANHEVLFEFAMAALRLTLHEDAARALVEALARRPDEPKFLYALARARMGTGDLNDAERLFRRYTELRPEDPTGHFGLGYVLAGMKRNEAARVSFDRSLALRPEQTESNYQLGLLDLADGDLDAAAARFGKVIERYRDHTGALLGMGKVYFGRKQYDAARQNLERVVALEPGLQQAHYHLSMTYARLGDKAAAAREAEISERLEREEKNRRRTILRLYEPTENVRPQGERKP
jgi:tetratricopeptide (TPR) repeat protein